MTTTGPNGAGTGGTSNYAFGTTHWTNTANITAADTTYSAVVLSTDNSHYLYASNFGFAIDAGDTILGIQMEVRVKGSVDLRAADGSVLAVKAGSSVGTDKATNTGIGTADAYVSYGGAADLWGTTWTAAQVNASNFGLRYSVYDLGGGVTVSCDYVRCTITHSAGTTTKAFRRSLLGVGV